MPRTGDLDLHAIGGDRLSALHDAINAVHLSDIGLAPGKLQTTSSTTMLLTISASGWPRS
jgi:hypothetical protein